MNQLRDTAGTEQLNSCYHQVFEIFQIVYPEITHLLVLLSMLQLSTEKIVRENVPSTRGGIIFRESVQGKGSG